jgi:hypothetical protein
MNIVRNLSQQAKSMDPSNILSANPNFQLAVVVDIILDENHPYMGKNQNDPNTYSSPTIKYQQIPVNYNTNVPSPSDIDYSYIGRAKIRILSLEKQTAVEKLPWAIPLDNTITQYPLINEQVMVLKIGDSYFYTKPLSKFNFVGTNGDFVTEKSASDTSNSAIPYLKPTNKESYISHPVFTSLNQTGFFGNYFIVNPYIRSVKKYEGDTSIESRFGQSIRFSAYDDNRLIDKNITDSSYVLDKNLFKKSSAGGYGNPKITIRNRQRNISRDVDQFVHPKLPKISKIDGQEKNYGGQIDEDINHDGSTIEISSGATQSKWKTTIYKSVFGVSADNDPIEEQTKFNPDNSTKFVMPVLTGDQVVINTDRLVLSSRFAETLHFSKKRYAVVTDNEYSVDANDQVVITTNRLTCLNSPQIFLGQYGETNEPAMLGQTTVDWLYDLCNWMLDHVHWYHHVHPHPHGHEDAGAINQQNTMDAQPNQTQIPVQQITLKLLRDNLHKTLSRRVFLTGGGYAPGSNGVKPPGSGAECRDPVKINTVTGEGVVGDFKGRNRREGPVQIEFEFQD